VDGRTSLIEPLTLTREHLDVLPNRAPHGEKRVFDFCLLSPPEGRAYHRCLEGSDMKAVILSHLCARRAAYLTLLSAALSSIFLAAPRFSRDAAAQSATVYTLEAENLTWSLNMGGDFISIGTCETGVSGGKFVIGVDYPGDWIEMNVTVSQPMFFRNSLHSAGDVGLRRKYAIAFLPAGGHGAIPARDTLTTPPGKGIT
jgi:hypothetical protein